MTTDVMDALVAENQRLQRELRELRQRLHAFEKSRWHRIHPRHALHRLRSSRDRDGDDARVPPRASEDGPAPNVIQFRQEVVARGAFSRDWLTMHLGPWEPLVERLEGQKSRLLEIGSYEGLSACYLLWRLPDATITCIDPFGRSPRIDSDASVSELEATFDANVALVGASRVRKLVGTSRTQLSALVADDVRFDLVYVDGSHLGLDVLVDAALSWRLLKPGGALVFDDYRYRDHGEDALLRPGPAIDAFLTIVEGKYEPLFCGHQLAVRKSPRQTEDLTARMPTITS